MDDKVVREWFLNVVWGKIALISWGDPSKEPVLLVHGYMDTAATFLCLVEHLPNSHYYVAVDLPGHGRSDPFPLGPLVNVGHYVEVVRAVVEDCQWTQFVYLTHSLGFIIGAMYNQAYPNKISCMINIDPSLAISQLYFTSYLNLWMPQRYDMYYTEVEQLKHRKPRVFNREQAIQYIQRRRPLTERQAELVVSRSLVPVGDGTFRLSWEPNSKLVAMITIPANTFYIIVTSNPKPMLILNASEDLTQELTKSYTRDLMQKITSKLHFVKEVTIEGGHDIHITNPGDCAKFINEFLRTDFNTNKKSKL